MSASLEDASSGREAATPLEPSGTPSGSSRLLPCQSHAGPSNKLLPSHQRLLDNNKGEESPLLTHCSASSSPLPDLLLALQRETQSASSACAALQNQTLEIGLDEDYQSQADHSSSDDDDEEYHSPLEHDEHDGIIDSWTCNPATRSTTTTTTTRGPADQVNHPLRISSYNDLHDASPISAGMLEQSPLSSHQSPLQPNHHALLRNTPPPTDASSTIGSSTGSTTSRRRQRQRPVMMIVPQPQFSQRSRSGAAPSISSSTSNTTTTSTASNLRRTRNNTNRVAAQHQSQHSQHQQHHQDSGLRASLDAGMATMRRWIRTRSSPNINSNSTATAATNTTTPIQPAQRSSSRSVSWQGETDQSAGGTSTSLGDEDLFGVNDDPRQSSPAAQQQRYHSTTTILEEEDEYDEEVGRQRSRSEPDALRIRHFFQRAVGGGSSNRNMRRRRGRRARAESEGMTRDLSSSPAVGRAPHLSPSAAAALYAQTTATTRLPEQHIDIMSSLSRPSGSAVVPTTMSLREVFALDASESMTAADTSMAAAEPAARLNASQESSQSEQQQREEIDPERQARIRWVRINRRFQLVITMVALLFSLLLFAILICWVVLTSAYVVSFEKNCNVPLKPYFWLVTLQLVLDVFRSDIMRFVFHWDPGSNQRIPCRVIAYNIAYLLYALLVLRLGIRSVFVEEETCSSTAPELFNSSAAFVSLSIAAWTTILCGYLLPFCVVAALLTHNGYNPSAHTLEDDNDASQAVFPAAYSTTGAPPGCVDQLKILRMDEFPDDYPRECCICMEDFDENAIVVETFCKHVYHKHCCRIWLRTARTCPVCRHDIPSTLEQHPADGDSGGGGRGAQSPRIPIGPTGRPVVGLLRILRHAESSNSGSGTQHSTTRSPRETSPSIVINQNIP